MRQDRVWEIIEKARDLQDQIDEIAENREETLLMLRGMKLTIDQKEAISNLEGYVAFELLED